MDLVLGERVVDRTGGPARSASPEAGISAVGDIAPNGAEEIDLDALTLAPGFIDIHTPTPGRSCGTVISRRRAARVTSVVMGNCGFGIAPDRQVRARLGDEGEHSFGSTFSRAKYDCRGAGAPARRARGIAGDPRAERVLRPRRLRRRDAPHSTRSRLARPAAFVVAGLDSAGHDDGAVLSVGGVVQVDGFSVTAERHRGHAQPWQDISGTVGSSRRRHTSYSLPARPALRRVRDARARRPDTTVGRRRFGTAVSRG